MSLECGKALKEVASAIRTMSEPSPADRHVLNSKTAAKNLESLLRSGLWENAELLAVMPAATVASLLFDVVKCTEKIVDSVHELASMAHFKTVDPTVSQEKEELPVHDIEQLIPVPKIDSPHVVTTVHGSSTGVALPENATPPPPISNIKKQTAIMYMNICQLVRVYWYVKTRPLIHL